VTELNQHANLPVFQTVGQFPYKNSVKAFRRIIEFVPDSFNRIAFFKAPIQTDEHIADIYLFHTLGQKSDVLLAYRPKVEHLGGWPIIKAFHEKLQSIAGIIDRRKPVVRILSQPI
jgi:hypothetical protein